jgi:ribosomal protein L44E
VLLRCRCRQCKYIVQPVGWRASSFELTEAE